MADRCLFCNSKESSTFTDEHIIPESLLFSAADDFVLRKSLCQECNCRRFGSIIDSEFLNNILVRLLRIIHKDFIKKDKIPAIRFKEFKTISIGQYDIPLDLIIDGSFNRIGALVVPTKAPIPNKQNSKEMIFLRTKKDISSLNTMLDKRKNYLVTNRGTRLLRFLPIPHEEFFLKMSDPLFKEMVFSRFIVKMALEYLAKSYGSDFIFRSEFARYHPFIMHQTDKCQIVYKLMLNLRTEWASYIRELQSAQFVTHTIGVAFDRTVEEWFFYFSLFDIAMFQFVLPRLDVLREESNKVKSFRRPECGSYSHSNLDNS